MDSLKRSEIVFRCVNRLKSQALKLAANMRSLVRISLGPLAGLIHLVQDETSTRGRNSRGLGHYSGPGTIPGEVGLRSLACHRRPEAQSRPATRLLELLVSCSCRTVLLAQNQLCKDKSRPSCALGQTERHVHVVTIFMFKFLRHTPSGIPDEMVCSQGTKTAPAKDKFGLAAPPLSRRPSVQGAFHLSKRHSDRIRRAANWREVST
jgi:hypothetical protein